MVLFQIRNKRLIIWFLASVYDETYEAMHAHCINLMLQGTLTFGQLVKLYTHQCFSRYPHFQVEDLSKNEKYTNNSTRFQGKGKRKQHQTFNKNGHGNFKRYVTPKTPTILKEKVEEKAKATVVKEKVLSL